MEPAPLTRVSTMDALSSILAERIRQDKKWGEQNHDFPVWLAILNEELGESAQEWLKANFESKSANESQDRRRNFREELVQTAAVALAMIECGDRNGWFEG